MIRRMRQNIVEINRVNYKRSNYHKLIWETINSGFTRLGEDQPQLYETRGFAGNLKLDQIISNINKGLVYYGYMVEDEMLACFALEKLENDVFRLINLVVKADIWGQGLGSWLLATAEEIVMDQGGKEIKLGMILSNNRLFGWYENQGYSKLNVKRNIVFMSKVLEYWITVNKFKKAINNSGNNCEVCGMWRPQCICEVVETGTMSIKIVLLSHENELERLTNTGRMIKKSFPKETHVIKWRRNHPSPLLLKLIENSSETYLVFPRLFSSGQVASLPDVSKNATFIIIDSTWDEAKKIVRKSDYLSDLPLVSFDVIRKSIYTLRRNQEIGALCTAEIALELLSSLNLHEEELLLKQNFQLFLQHYDSSQKQIDLTKS